MVRASVGTRRSWWRRTAAAVAMATICSLLGPAAAQDPAPPGPQLPTERVAGPDRFATAAAVSRAAFADPDTVYVAPGGQFAYALAGGPRAARDGAPVLLIDGDAVPVPTAAELERIAPEEIVVLGGTDVIGEATVAALANHGPVRRVGATGVVESVAAIARDGWPDGADRVYLATDRDFPDALAGGVAGALTDGPVLLTRTGHLPAATVAALEELDPDQVVLLGGTAAISDGVALQLGELGEAIIVRWGGTDRIGTTLEASDALHASGEAVDVVWIATAGNFPDAMASAPAVAASGGALLLTRGDCLPYLVRDEIARLAPQRIVVLGGTAAVSDEAAALETCEELPPPPTVEVVDADPVGEQPALGDSGPRPVVEVVDDEGVAARMVEDEVIVSTRDEAAFERWLEETGGEVLQTIDGVDALPPTHVVRLPPPSAAFAQADLEELGRDLQWLSGTATGAYEVATDTMLSTLATATDSLAEGMAIGLNIVLESDELIDAEVQESAAIGTLVPSRNPFTWPQFAYDGVPSPGDGLPGPGTAEAWRLLVANDRDEPRARIAVVDGGFAASNGDYPPDITGTNGDPNPTTCSGRPCPWHGTDVIVAAAGVLDNEFGSVGSAGPVGLVRPFNSSGSVGAIIDSLARLLALGIPEIVNMSGGAPVPAVPALFLKPLDLVTRTAHEGFDVVLVAAAGNDGTDVNREQCVAFVCWERQTYVPCELAGVYCVGGVTTGTRNRASGSNFGREACDNPVCGVTMFAPYTVVVGENPDVGVDAQGVAYDNRGDQLRSVSGTSFSAPYISGVFALLRAAAPDMRAYEMVTLLNQTAHPSTHPEVGRVVNTYAAVRAALGPDARTLIGPNRTPSPFPQDPIPAVAFSAALGNDQGALRGDAVTSTTAPGVRWVTELPGTDDTPNHPWANPPLVAGDVLVVPVRDLADPDRLPVEVSLVGLDLETGETRWQVDHIVENCLPVVDRDGTVWALRGHDQLNVLEWRYTLLAIDPATGRERAAFATPREAGGDLLRDCDTHPLRLTPDGTRLVLWQGQLQHGEHSSLRVLDITLPDVVETANVRLEHTLDGGAGSRFNPDKGWVQDVRIAADRPTAYLMERDAGADPEDVYDDEWWLHAIDLATLPRTADLDDPGVIDRSIRLPVGAPGIGSWTVVGDQVIVAGAEFLSGSTRFPGDGDGVAGRTFAVRDDGTTLTEVARAVAVSPGATPAPGQHSSRPVALAAATDDVLVAHTLDGATIGMDPTTLAQVWRTDGVSLDPTFHHANLVVDDAGNAIVPGVHSDSVAAVTASGGTRWTVPLDGDAAVHPVAVGPSPYDFNPLSDFRLAGLTPEGRILLTAVGPDGVVVIALG